MSEMQRVVLASRPKGSPTLDNFRLETAELPEPGPGEMLLRTIWLSLDPYMRGRMDDVKSYADPVPLGGTMEGACVAEVMMSNIPAYKPGDIVMGGLGWTSHAISDLVGQLAKRKGMRVIGVAGGREKCAYAVESLGYDLCLDHRDPDLRAALKAAVPEGIDCYYENVGGVTLEAVLPLMNIHGRIAVCGMIAWYSGKGIDEAPRLPVAWRAILTKRLRVQGFIIFDHFDRLPAFLAEVAPLVAAGKIHYRETVAEGLENAPTAFLRLLEGGNFGKQLVRVGPDP